MTDMEKAVEAAARELAEMVRDLANHLFPKQPATAFQVGTLTLGFAALIRKHFTAAPALPAQSVSGVMRREDVERASHAELLENARSAASRLLGYCEQNEAEFTGWGDQIVPPEAEALTAQAQRIFDAFDAHAHTGQPVEGWREAVLKIVDDICVLSSPPAADDYERAMHDVGTEITKRVAALAASPQKREG